MTNQPFPFAVRLIGFSEEESAAFDASFASGQGKGYAYVRLREGNLQDPDLYIANADSLKALVTLVDLRPSEIRPALLVGTPVVDLPYPRIARPLQWHALFATLDELVEKRADVLARLEASDVVAVPERRRYPRLDIDLTDPAEYAKMRAAVPRESIVLVVDKAQALRDYLAKLLTRKNLRVEWAGDEAAAAELCKRETATVVLINASTPGVDPYRLCRAIKGKDAPACTVIFLVGASFVYDVQQARAVGADGFLSKPLARHHLSATLKKFLPQSR